MMTFGSFTRRFVKPLALWYIGGFVILAGVNLITLEIPQLAKEVVNDLIAHPDGAAAPAAHIVNTTYAIIGLGFLLIISRTLSRVVIFWPGRKLETGLKAHLFEKVIRAPQAFFLQHGLGDLISRMSNDVGQIRAFFAFGLLQILNVVFLLVFTITKMASMHATLTVLTLVPLLSMLVISRIAMPKMHRLSRENQEALGALTSKVTEAFVNVHVVQANAAEDAFTARSEPENERVYRTNVQLIVIRTVIFPLMTCLSGLSQLAVLFYGGHEAIAGRLTVGDILAFNVYIGMLSFPLTAIGIILPLYQRAKTGLERIGVIDEAKEEGASSTCTSTPTSTSPALLDVRGLTYAHPGASDAAVAGISFSVAPGKKLGLFGRVGSGKSTLLGLIARLADPPPGTIHLDGKDVLALDPRVLRQEVGYALQQAHLFSDTISANLSLGAEPAPSQTDLESAARAAQILPEIEAFKDGWNTQIGEKGLRLSGGQKQRLALARLFLRRQRLILLDDVLSAVDHATERRLIDHINGLGCAMIIASHRGSALKRCDEILIMERGRVVDRGTFEDLAARHPALAVDA